MKKKLNFLIHPYYRKDVVKDDSEHEKTAASKWYREIEKIAGEPNKFLIILSTSREKEQQKKQAVDQKIISFAQEKLGDRCIVLPYVETDIPEYADQLKKELKNRGIISKDSDLREFSSAAFGEYAELCVLQIADELNQSLGLKRKTQVSGYKSLSIDGPDSKKVNSAVREVINKLNLKRVVARDKKIKK